MILKTEKKVVLITGSSSGIGRATAVRFARAGYAVVVTYVREAEAGKGVLDECVKAGAPDAILVQLDVTDQASIAQALETVMKKFSRIDILINNAGIAVKSPLVEQNPEIIDSQIVTNLLGAILVTRAFLPVITKGIMFIGSKTALAGKRKMSVYSATKFGVRGFAQSLALEYPQLHILLVNPGLVATRMGKADGESPEKVANSIFKSALGEYWVSSGGDVNVWEYQYGKIVRYGILFFGFVKKLVKKIW